ncbi:MAG: hypothetical protein KDE56_24355, partial [Anaerolineales bacterium]|nr:hypothetical protein [Anaerolineales bacterium]
TAIAIPTVQLPDLSIHGIELTQGVQCFDSSKGIGNCPDNSLPVVNKKDATARIYLKYNSGPNSSMNGVPVRLHIRANGVWYEANASGKATTSINQANSDSADVYFNVNFANDVVVDFYAVVDPNNNIAESNESNNRYPANGYITKTFRRTETLDIVGRRLRYHPSGYGGSQYAGGWSVNGGAADYFEQLLPIRTNGVDYSLASGYLDWTKNLGVDTNQHDLIGTLNFQWIQQNLFSWIFGTGAFTGAEHVYGWAPNDGYSGGHADMPVYPHAGGLGVVGIGTDRPGTSTDNPGGGTYIFAHELLHDYDLKHTDTGSDDCGSNDDSSTFPYSTSSIQEFGFNPITGKIYDPANTHDVLSYCPGNGSKEGWISPYTWNYMYNRLDALAQQTAVRSTQPSDGESLIVKATIYNPEAPGYDPNTPGTLDDLYRVADGFAYPVAPGDYEVQLRNGDTVLASQTFAVGFESEYSAHPGFPFGDDDPPFPSTPTLFANVAFVMPWVEGTTSVVLVHGGEVWDKRPLTPNAPTVTITSPTAQTTWTAGGVGNLSWSASDADGDPLTYDVFYSADNGQSWTLLAAGLSETTYEVEVDALAGSSDGRFRVVANDGLNIGYAETPAAIVIPNKAPFVTLANPLDGSEFVPGGLVVLVGSGTDLEDGNIPDEKLVWSSDRQGELGYGSSLPIATLEPGTHQITLTATDSYGISSSETVSIFIGYRLYLPVAAKK